MACGQFEIGKRQGSELVVEPKVIFASLKGFRWALVLFGYFRVKGFYESPEIY